MEPGVGRVFFGASGFRPLKESTQTGMVAFAGPWSYFPRQVAGVSAATSTSFVGSYNMSNIR